MFRIFSRSHGGGNEAPDRRQWRPGIMLAACALVGCATPASIPANVVLRDVHNNGYALAFDRTVTVLASGGSEGTIRLWTLPRGTEISGWPAHDGSVQGLHFLARGHELLSAGYDAALIRWTRQGRPIRRITTPAPIIDLAVDELSDLVITGHADGVVRRWRLDDLSPLDTRAVHDGAVYAVAHHPASRRLASSGSDGRVYLWRAGETPQALPAPPTDARDLAFTPDGQYLLGSGWFQLYRWRIDDATLAVLPTPHLGLISAISLSADGLRLASIGRHTDSAVYLLDAQTGAVLKRYQPHGLCGTVVQLAPDGNYLASTSDDANVHLWDLRQPLPERTFFGEP